MGPVAMRARDRRRPDGGGPRLPRASRVRRPALRGPETNPAQLSAKRWRTLKPSPLERTEVAATRVGRFIYVVGGFIQSGGGTTNKVARYDIRRDRWRLVAPMPLAVNHAAATAWAGRLYVQGGFASASRPRRRDLAAVRVRPLGRPLDRAALRRRPARGTRAAGDRRQALRGWGRELRRPSS